jgi:hypothetical protein
MHLYTGSGVLMETAFIKRMAAVIDANSKAANSMTAA